MLPEITAWRLNPAYVMHVMKYKFSRWFFLYVTCHLIVTDFKLKPRLYQLLQSNLPRNEAQLTHL